MIAAIALGSVANLIIYLLVAGLIFWLLHWLVGYLAIPEPFNKVVRVILAVLAVIVIIDVLLKLTGGSGFIRL